MRLFLLDYYKIGRRNYLSTTVSFDSYLNGRINYFYTTVSFDSYKKGRITASNLSKKHFIPFAMIYCGAVHLAV
jgi:hypothetical protein